MEIDGEYVRKRVPPMGERGKFRGRGTLSIQHGRLVVRGRRIPSLKARWVIGFASYFLLAAVTRYLLIVAFSGHTPGQVWSIMMFPIIAVAYFAGNSWFVVRDEFDVPISDVDVVTTDPTGTLLALSVPRRANSSPVVMNVGDRQILAEALEQLNLERNPHRSTQIQDTNLVH